MSCFRITKTNDNGSLLFQKLLEITKDEQLADELYAYFDISQEDSSFREIFGDYITNFKANKISDRVDENGEPILFFNEKLNKHFFKDIDNEPVYFPYTRQGLGKYLSTKDVKEFAKILALKFYETNLDFDFTTLEFTRKNATSLDSFIADFLGTKSDELLGNPNFRMKGKGIALNQTTDNISEWVTEVKDFFQTLKLDYVDLTDSETAELQASEMRGEIARQSAFLKSSKNNVNNNIKLFLALSKTTTKNLFNEFNFVSFDDIYSTLNKTLANIVPTIDESGQLEDPYELYVEEIEKLVTVKPYFKELYDRMRASNVTETFKNQFVVAFNLHKNNFLGSEIARDDAGNISYTVRNLSQVGTRKASILNQWFHNFTTKNLSKGQLNGIQTDLITITKNINKDYKNITTDELFNEYKATVERILDDLGIKFTKQGFEFFLNNLSLDVPNLENKKSKLQKLTKDLSYTLKEAQINEETNPFLHQNITKQLAEAEAFFMKEGTDASIFTLGKTKWNYSMPSYIDLQVGKWKKDPNSLMQLYNSTPYSKGSYYMRYLLALDVNGIDENRRKTLSQQRIDAIEVGIFNSVQQRNNASEASDNKSISHTDALVDYINKILGYKKPNGKSYHKTALAADKSTEYQIYYGVEALETAAEYRNGDIEVDEHVLDIFYNYFKSEYERMFFEHEFVQENDSKALIPKYHLGTKNAFKSQLFPSMSITYDKDGNVVLPTMEAAIYDENGKPLYKNLDEIKEQILPIISSSIHKGVETTFKELLDSQVLTFNENGILENNSLDSAIYNSYKESGKSGNKIAIQLAADIFVNSVASQVEYSKMFTGDTAYYKDVMDYKKRVPATYTDGLYMRLLNGEQDFNISVIKGVEVPAPSLSNLKSYLSEKAYKHYERVNATDAQAWITPARWKFIMERIGKFTSQRAAVYEKMLQDNPVFTSSELKLLAQPLKGVYFGMQKNNKPIFLKYSQAVLLPNMIKGTQLEDLYNKMVKDENGKELPFSDQIHELITEDGIKVGSLQPEVTNDNNGDVLDSFTLNKMSLSNANWKMQQDLPVKGIKPTDVGSQIQVNIFQGLVYNTDTIFEIDGKKMTNIDVINHLNNIVGDLSNKGLQKLYKKFAIDPATGKIENEDALYSSMIEQLKTRSDVPSNFIKALEAGISPYGIPGSFSMFQNVFSAIVNKETIKIKTNGGGYIQMADYGISYEKSKKQGITFTPWFTKDKTSAKLHTPEKYVNEETGKETIIPGAIFLGGSLIAKYIPNYKQLSSKELFGTWDPISETYIGGRLDQEILTNIIGYRIPNQGLPSNDALMVAGILPEESGDTIIPYTGMTAKTGSDFDIDKMFLMIPSFTTKFPKATEKKALDYIKKNKLTAVELIDELEVEGYDREALDKMTQTALNILFGETVLLDINSENNYAQEFQNSIDTESATRLIYQRAEKNEYGDEYPLHEQPLGVIQNKLIEAYKSILLNKDVINDVMNSIDLSHIKDDVKNLLPAETTDDLMAFDAVTDLELKKQFALGKAGLGQNVNASQDAVRGAMAQQTLNEMYLGWGNSNIDGESIFDSEYSVELSDKDIRDYVRSYNKGIAESKHITYDEVASMSKLSLNETMMTLINAFVDIAKDAYIVQGNWVTQTNNTGFMLLRAGVHPFYINAFLAQPILKDYVKFRNNMESQTIQDTVDILPKFKLQQVQNSLPQEETITLNGKSLKLKHLFRTTVKLESTKYLGKPTSEKYAGNVIRYKAGLKEDIAKVFNISTQELITNPAIATRVTEIVDQFVELYQDVFNAKPLSFDKLGLGKLRDQIKVKSDISTQLGILNLFDTFKDPAKIVAKSTKASRITVDGKGKNINSLIIANNRVNNMILQESEPGGLNGFSEKLTYDGKSTMLGHYKQNSIDAVYKIMRANPKYFFSATNSVVSTFNHISYGIYGESLENNNLGDKLERGYYSYVMSGFPALQTSNEKKTNLLTNLPNKLMELKETSNNPLIKALIIKEGTAPFKFYISMPNLKKTVTYKNTLTEAWAELLETNPEFADDLIKYSHIITGFNNSINQFHEFIPYEWFNKNRFNSYLKRLELNAEFIDYNFMNQFFRNNHADNSLTKRVFMNQVDKTKSDFMKSTYTLKAAGHAPFFTKYTFEDDGGNYYERYFRLLGYDNGKGVYVRTSLLGNRDANTNSIVEYDITTKNKKNGLKSVVPTNKLTSRQIDIALFTKTINRTDIIPEFNINNIVTEESIKSKEPKAEKQLKKGVVEIYNNNKELQQIGSVEQYNNYINSIFPASKLREIVYHGTGTAENITELKTSRGRIYFSNELTAAMYSAWDADNRTQEDPESKTNARSLPAIINLTNPTRLDSVSYQETETNKDGDGIIGTNIADPLGGTETQYVVRSTEQVHLLGTEKDIQGFKEYLDPTIIKPYTLVENLNVNGQDRLASLNPKTGVIRIEANITVEKFFNYFTGNTESTSSKQKQKVLEKVAEQEYTLDKIKEMIQTKEQAIEFLYLHEQDHIDNNDTDVYWIEGTDLLTADKVEMETRATINALNQMGVQEKTKKGDPNQTDMFDQADPFKCKQ